jgi:hypothetical protein
VYALQAAIQEQIFTNSKNCSGQEACETKLLSVQQILPTVGQ